MKAFDTSGNNGLNIKRTVTANKKVLRNNVARGSGDIGITTEYYKNKLVNWPLSVEFSSEDGSITVTVTHKIGTGAVIGHDYMRIDHTAVGPLVEMLRAVVPPSYKGGAMTPQPPNPQSTDTQDELREQRRQCFRDTYMETQGDTELFDTKKTIAALEALFTQQLNKAVVEARESENLACQNIIRSKWGTNDQLWEMQDRLATLKQQLKEGK